MKYLFTLLSVLCCAATFAAPPTITTFSPTSAAKGMTVTITGTAFTGATGVKFGTVNALSFNVVSSTQIDAVVGVGTSGQISVITAGGTATRAGFIYTSISGLVTDFGGYWSSTAAANNVVIPDDSHNLLAFTYNGVTYSTGANNGPLLANSVSFTSGSFKALPVASIIGTAGTSGSTYLALAKKVDGNVSSAYVPAVNTIGIKAALIDGLNGLNLGTGVTNLPGTAVFSFEIFNINPSAINDEVPDILLTQIAQPSAGNDEFGFIDASGIIVGQSVTQDMTLLPKLGTYETDLFTLTNGAPYNTATAYGVNSAAQSKEIRLVGFKLSDFGITPANVSSIKALKISPSSNSDYAFIAYNTNAINLPPSVTRNDAATNDTICSGGAVKLAILSTPATGGALSYAWEGSTDGGSTWTSVSNGGIYSGATTNQLLVGPAANGNKFRATVTESGSGLSATSPVFTVTVRAPSSPTAVTISGGGSTCANSSVLMTSAVTGGSNVYYQWQSNSGGPFANIDGANNNVYTAPTSTTGVTGYRLVVSGGNGCGSAVTSSVASVTVAGISSTAPAAICSSGAMTLTATATSGNIDWFGTDAGGTSLRTGGSYTTPALSATKTYYVSTDGCTGGSRVPVTATVNPAPVAGSIYGATTVMTGNNNTTLYSTSNTGTVKKWQSSTDSFVTVINDIAVTTDNLTIVNLATNTQYRTVIQSAGCGTTTSSFVSMRVSSTLPIHSASVRASRQGGGVLVQWTAYDQDNTDLFDLERATDGLHFTRIASIQPAGVNAGSTDYRSLDPDPAKGYNYYRIREWFHSGATEVSSTVKVFIGDTNGSVNIFPNPASGRSLNVQLNDLPAGNYQLRLINAIGQVLIVRRIAGNGQSQVEHIELGDEVIKGLYKLEVTNGKDFREVNNLLVN